MNTLGLKMKVLIGVDIGTTNLKAVAFTPDGMQVSKVSAPTPTLQPKLDWVEYDPEELWKILAGIIKGLIDKLGKSYEPEAISFTGMAETAIPLDTDGTPLYPAISWLDRRILSQMRAWGESFKNEDTAQITGLPLSPSAGILRLLWIRDHHPEIYDKTSAWLNLPDFAAFKLCGEKCTEYSLATRMMILDISTSNWSDHILRKLGLSADLFGRLVHSGELIGTVSQIASQATGLPVGLPVCAGGHDHLSAAVGLGVTGYDTVFDSIGTAEAILTCIEKQTPVSNLSHIGIERGQHVLSDMHYVLTGNAFGGGSVDWIKDILYSDAENEIPYDKLINDAEKTPSGSLGAFFLPHLRRGNPPNLDPHSRGAFIGLTADHGPGAIARSVFEGLAFEFQQLFDTITDHFSIQPKKIVAAGGGTRNALFMQIKSDISGLPIEVPQVEEATCLGAAIAGGYGTGIFDNLKVSSDQFTLSIKTFEPDKVMNEFYKERYQNVFKKLYHALAPLHEEVSKWQNN